MNSDNNHTIQARNVIKLFPNNACKINKKNWKSLTIYLWRIHNHLQHSIGTIMLGMKLINDFLTLHNADINRLQLYGIVTGFIASHMIEINPAEIDDWITISNYRYSEKTFRDALYEVIITFDGKLYPPTIISILDEMKYEGKNIGKNAYMIAIMCYMINPGYFTIGLFDMVNYIFSLENSLIRGIVLDIEDVTKAMYNDIKRDESLLQPHFSSIITKFKHPATRKTLSYKPTIPTDHNITEKKKSYDKAYSLGEGIYGQVFLATRNHNIVAIKEQDIEKHDAWLVELSILSTYRGGDVIRMFDFYLYNNTIEMDFESAQSLKEVIYGDNRNYNIEYWYDTYILNKKIVQPIELNKRRTIMKGICDGIMYLHSHGIIHRDIKLDNILIVREDQVKISDFGLSYQMCLSNKDSIKKDLNVITIMNRPPDLFYYQLIKDKVLADQIKDKVSRYNFDADVWSVGSVLLEIETGIMPFHYDLIDYVPDYEDYPLNNSYRENVLWAISMIIGSPDYDDVMYPHFPFDHPSIDFKSIEDDVIKELISMMLKWKPGERISMMEIFLQEPQAP